MLVPGKGIVDRILWMMLAVLLGAPEATAQFREDAVPETRMAMPAVAGDS